MKLYLDTSVYGGYYDEVFCDPTKKFFSVANENNLTIYYSSFVKEEIDDAHDSISEKLNYVMDLIKKKGELNFSNEISNLANHYIVSGVLSKKSLMDARHIALATYYDMDFIISWNFKHMINKKDDLNVINLRLGEKFIKICTPHDFLNNYEK